MRRSITFVHAPAADPGQTYGTRLPPLWAYTLAAHVPAGWTAEIVEADDVELEALPAATVFAFSGMNQDVPSVVEACRALRRRHPSARFIVGGPMTWSLEQEDKLDRLDAFDHVFVLDGEEILPAFLRAVEADLAGDWPRVSRPPRFRLRDARPASLVHYARHAGRYTGAVVEVSRGCPFLCEFCDIRVLPGNDRSNNKPVDLVVEEVARHVALGATEIVLACDNFIGDVAWARACAGALRAWREATGARVSIFTWATLNLAKLPDLMSDLRHAGVSTLFIGLESVNAASLAETAKVQNLGDMRAAVAAIQGHGFLVAPGLIFGFDSDTPAVFEDTLAYLEAEGILGGDPSFLSALPGTPLFARLRQTRRLVEDDSVVVRRKIATNVRYVMSSHDAAEGFTRFARGFISARSQLERFRAHLRRITESSRYVPVAGVKGRGALRYLASQLSRRAGRRALARRIAFLSHPSRLLALARGLVALLLAGRARRGLGDHFLFWVYTWTNLALKYRSLEPGDFALHDVGPGFDVRSLAAFAPHADVPLVSLVERRAAKRAAHQAKLTREALGRLARARSGDR